MKLISLTILLFLLDWRWRHITDDVSKCQYGWGLSFAVTKRFGGRLPKTSKCNKTCINEKNIFRVKFLISCKPEVKLSFRPTQMIRALCGDSETNESRYLFICRGSFIDVLKDWIEFERSKIELFMVPGSVSTSNDKKHKKKQWKRASCS